MGYKVDTLVGVTNPLKKAVKDLIWISKIILKDGVSKRSLNISKFNRRYIHKRLILVHNGTFSPKIAKEYDFFAVGSDQVWNPEIRKRERGVFFLDFANDKQKICISPSLSVKEIDEQYKEKYKEELSKFPILTCRELDGAKLIEKLTGKKCINTIDPTLMLRDKEWKSLSKRININGKFIVLFFLGDIPSSITSIVNLYANKNRLLIINPLDINNKYSCLDPFEFVWLIDNAELVLTDSFHATAFSINLKTSFYVFDRSSNNAITTHINSRIAALVNTFDLKDRYITDLDQFEIKEKCDFLNVDKHLLEERNKFLNVLRESLGDNYVETF